LAIGWQEKAALFATDLQRNPRSDPLITFRIENTRLLDQDIGSTASLSTPEISPPA